MFAGRRCTGLPLDMLNAMKPYGTEAEQDFIDLIINFLQGSQLYQSYMDSMDVPDQEIPRQEPRQEQVHNQERSQNEHSHDRIPETLLPRTEAETIISVFPSTRLRTCCRLSNSHGWKQRKC
ncbi:MAG: hypothetical protein ACLUOI_08565 [Eisenbergiella sp.]